MKRILFTALMCVFAVSAIAQDKKKDWAQFGRYEKANEEVLARDVRPDAVFMGNSITDGWARQDPEFFDSNNFVGRGIGGQTSSEMLVRFRRDVIDLNPKCVVIFLVQTISLKTMAISNQKTHWATLSRCANLQRPTA